MKQSGDSRLGVRNAPEIPFPQITTDDLDIPFVGQLLAANLRSAMNSSRSEVNWWLLSSGVKQKM
jgi:hypothetical protein